MKIKVSRLKLVEAIKVKRQEKIEEEKKLKDGQPAAFTKFKEDTLDELNRVLSDVSKAKTVKEIERLTDGYKINNRLPDAPEVKSAETGHFDEAIKRLKLCDEETLTLDEKDNYFDYI